MTEAAEPDKLSDSSTTDSEASTAAGTTPAAAKSKSSTRTTAKKAAAKAPRTSNGTRSTASAAKKSPAKAPAKRTAAAASADAKADNSAADAIAVNAVDEKAANPAAGADAPAKKADASAKKAAKRAPRTANSAAAAAAKKPAAKAATTATAAKKATAKAAATGSAAAESKTSGKADTVPDSVADTSATDEASETDSSAGSKSSGSTAASSSVTESDSTGSVTAATEPPTTTDSTSAESATTADESGAGNTSGTDSADAQHSGDEPQATTADGDAAEDQSGTETDTASPTGDDAHAGTGSFIGHGARIDWRAWLPEGDVRGVIVLVHGVAEHAGRYEHVGQRLAGAGFAVYALDHPGHGTSGGSRANIGSMDAAADNVATLLAVARREFPAVPAFLLGHSMGSLIVLFLATRAPIEVDGVVVSAPPLDIAAGNPIQRLLAPVLTRLTPNLGVLMLDSSDISRDPEVVAAYDNDPLVFRGKLPARTATEILNASVAVKGRLHRLTVPTLAMHGTADTIAAPSSTDLIEKGAGTKDLTVQRYDGLYHEIFNEPEQDQVLSDVVDWLEAHLDKS